MAVTQTLSVTEVAGSVNTSTNTSKVRILWQSTQSGDSWNGYTRTAKYYISVNGGAETEHSVSYTLPQNSTKTILDVTTTVTHKDDGTGSIKVRTWMDTSISAGVVEKSQSLTLTTIARASTITSASNVTLGNACNIKWSPKSKDFRYKIKFALGGFSYTTGAIHPNSTSAFTYTEYPIPLTVANQLKSAKSGTMTATLYTYSDSGATVQVGSASSTTFTVTIPDNASTKPSITMTLAPDTPYATLSSVYLQGRSKVKATFSGSGQYGATIKSYAMKIGTKSYASPYTSDILSSSGDITVTGIVTDSRGFTNTTTQTITVCAYDKPSIIPYTGENRIICRRCLADGTLDDGGTYLLIKIGRKYSKVVSGGAQKNLCTLSYRYKTDAQNESAYSNPITILAESASSDDISTIIPNVVSSNTTAYNIRLIAEDTAGEKDIVTITIPTSFVTAHAPEGGHGITFGGYHDPSKVDVFDCYFNAEFHGTVSGSVLGLLGSSGNIPSNGDLNDYRVPGVYAIPSDTVAKTLKNIPLQYAGLLRVYTSTGQNNVSGGEWVYLMQEFRPHIANIPEYRREVWTDSMGTWKYGAWVSGIENVIQLDGWATQMVAKIHNENNVEVCQLVIRQGTDYHFLNLSPSGIEYGKNGSVYWKK